MGTERGFKGFKQSRSVEGWATTNFQPTGLIWHWNMPHKVEVLTGLTTHKRVNKQDAPEQNSAWTPISVSCVERMVKPLTT